MEHDNSRMSLAVYLAVEKPNKNLKRTLALIHIDSPIVCIDKLKNNNIDVWSKYQTEESDNSNE